MIFLTFFTYYEKVKADFPTYNESSYSCHILMRTPAVTEIKEKTKIVRIKTGYSRSPIWRSMLLPGWGQLYKKQPLKGHLFIATHSSLLTSIYYFYFYKNEYLRKGRIATSESEREYYYNNSKRAEETETILIIASGIVYVYNLCDAIFFRGSKEYEKQRSLDNNIQIGITPERQLSFSFSF